MSLNLSMKIAIQVILVCIMVLKIKITAKVFIRHYDGISDVTGINDDDLHSIFRITAKQWQNIIKIKIHYSRLSLIIHRSNLAT